MNMKPHSSRVAVLMTALALAGCNSTSNPAGTTPGVSLSTTQAVDASASLEALSALDQVADAAAASALATGDAGFTIAQVASPSPSPSASASASPSPSPSASASAGPGGNQGNQGKRGKPTGAVNNTVITVNSTAGTTSVANTVNLGGNNTKVNGTNTVTRVFTGVVSQTADVQAALKEIRDKAFPPVSVTHAMTLTNPGGTRTSTRTCTIGATVTCTTTATTPNVEATTTTTVNKTDKSETGTGTVTHKKTNKTRNLVITINADGSSTRTVTTPGGVVVTLNKAADGTVTGTVVKDGQTLATITADANGNLVSSDGQAAENSDKAKDDVS